MLCIYSNVGAGQLSLGEGRGQIDSNETTSRARTRKQSRLRLRYWGAYRNHLGDRRSSG